MPRDTHAYSGRYLDVVEPGTHGQDVTHGWRSDTPDNTPDEEPFLRVCGSSVPSITSTLTLHFQRPGEATEAVRPGPADGVPSIGMRK